MTEFANRLLHDLPASEAARVQQHLIQVPLVRNQVLCAPGQPILDYHFVTDGVVSLTMRVNGNDNNGNDNDTMCEVGLVGDDGLVGVAALLAPDRPSPYQAVVQVSGTALRVLRPSAVFEACPVLHRRLMHYTAVLMHQMGQVAACNLRHTVQERLSRWLLMTHDRLHDNTLPLTQEFLAVMLGVRRAGVSIAANTQQAAGVVRLGRGRITVLDVSGLENTACHCYRTMRQLYGTAYNNV